MGNKKKMSGCCGCFFLLLVLITLAGLSISWIGRKADEARQQGVATTNSATAAVNTSSIASTNSGIAAASTASVTSGVAHISSKQFTRTVTSESAIQQETKPVKPADLGESIEKATGSAIAIIMMVLVVIFWLAVLLLGLMITAFVLMTLYKVLTDD